MKDDRFRVPVDTAYLTTLGRAIYCFARMEWSAVYCGEKLDPGYVNGVAEKTAGQIATDIVDLARRIPDRDKRRRYQKAAVEFACLVKCRNDLVHANPATVGDDQRLSRRGVPWHPSEIDHLADEFAACEMGLDELYQHVL